MGQDRERTERTAIAEVARPARDALPIAWPTLVALILVVIGFLVLPDDLRAGSGVLAPALMAGCTTLFAVLTGLDHFVWGGHPMARRWTRRLSLLLTFGMTVAIALSAIFLVRELSRKTIAPMDLLLNGGVIWVINVLVFAIWYWEVDAGGPHARQEAGYTTVDFVFPQFAADDPKLGEGWMPGFVDYLFLSFNANTAFSPTDTMVLSRRAKLLMMAQSAIALVVFGVLLARAVGTV